MLAVAYLTLCERKVIGWMQIAHRAEPRRAARACCSRSPTCIKLLFKEIILPASVEQVPVPARAADRDDAGARGLGGDAVRRRSCVLADIDAGLLYILALTSIGRLRRDHRGLGVELEVRASSARCARRRRWSPTRSRWASRWWRC